VLGGKLTSLLGQSDEYATAFQLAIWEIVNETSLPYSLDDGSFTRDSGSAAAILANAWLADLNAGAIGWTPATGLLALTSSTVQDMLVQTPIPAAAWLLGSGLLGLFGISRRRQRKAVA
jgi:hypothetical protein